jgi:hypothetical protein
MADNAGPAFPTPPAPKSIGGQHDGMSLRDYFAAAAMQALITKGMATTPRDEGQQLCSYAYKYADAMIRERSN